MTNLVLLKDERSKKQIGAQKKLIAGLQELLALAESGEIKAICYAGIAPDGGNITLGILHSGLAEIIKDPHLELTAGAFLLGGGLGRRVFFIGR